jgi:hypothetical protein
VARHQNTITALTRRGTNIQSCISRRQFLCGIAGSLALSGTSRLALAFPDSPYLFEEVPTSTSGITWLHSSGKSADRYLPETNGAGCGFLDYDNDGWMDIYLVNAGKCDFFTPNPPLRNALYHNNRDGTFTDVTVKAGVMGGGYGQGVAVGDYDGDGFPDLYVTQYGSNILYRNNGDGTFTDVTQKAGVAAPGWSSSAVWFDYDNDGRLDLFVCRFVDFDKSKSRHCSTGGAPGYCVPRIYEPSASWLFHNNGDGTFTDVSKETGIAKHLGKSWGVVATDINNDGRMDLFVSNDTMPNFLYVNRGGGKFEEIGEQAGVAYSDMGRARSGMGVDSLDLNQDGWLDLFVNNITGERFALYQNNQDETFDDHSGPAGIGLATQPLSGWGVKFFDYDNDGDMDVLLANGDPGDLNEAHMQLPMLFRGTSYGFQNISDKGGPFFNGRLHARGLAVGDFNNDGGVDVLVSVIDSRPVLLRNNVGSQNHWLGIKLIGKKANIDAVGARVTYQAADLKRSRMKVGGGSFMSSHDPRMVLGIGKRTKFDWVEIKWPEPSGLVQRFTDLPLDRYVTIRERQAKWE